MLKHGLKPVWNHSCIRELTFLDFASTFNPPIYSVVINYLNSYQGKTDSE